MFFEKDPIDWNGYQYEKFYTDLLQLKFNNAALKNVRNDAVAHKINGKGNPNVMAFRRDGANKKVLFFVNLSTKEQKASYDDAAISGDYSIFGSNASTKLNINKKHSIVLPAGAWMILVEYIPPQTD